MNFCNESIDYFKKNKITFNVFPENYEKSFDSIEEFYNFISNECEYWKPCNQGDLMQIYNYFNSILQTLNNFYNNSYFSSYINEITQRIKRNNFPEVFSITSDGKYLKNIYQKNIKQAEAFCDYKIKHAVTNSSNLYDINYLKGMLTAFTINDSEMAATLETNSQRDALLGLHGEFESKLNETHNKFIEKSDEADKLIIEIKESSAKLMDEVKINDKNLLDENHAELDKTKNNFNKLEELYKEKLKLAAPAEYWRKLSEEYKKRGYAWTTVSVVVSIIFLILLTCILYYLPESLSEQNEKLSFMNLRGAIIFALIVSIGVYIIRLFTKLAISSFHLERDAKEREQLTYVYLALIKSGGVSTEDRNIVLQAIFSRADTGLLKGDSSPTLPDGVVSQILKNIGTK